MKRFHVHMNVENLQTSIAFYSSLFSAPPTRTESDYAKWMLEDPRINFAISTRSNRPGLDHLGFQTDSAEELEALKTTAQSAEMAVLDEGETACCYAKSDKHWIIDPTGIPWEHFRNLGSIPVFNEQEAESSGQACCIPTAAKSVSVPENTSGSCC